jgi:FemAB-related protein (PEP-CTERM system-associated)
MPVFLRSSSEGKLTGIMPLVEIKSRLFGHAIISNAFAVAGGALASNEKTAIALTDEAVRFAERRGADYLEIRDCSGEVQGFQSRSDLYATFERHIEKAEEKTLLQIPRKQRAVVRKAIGGDFTVTIDHDVECFFKLFARTARDHGTPVFAKRHFYALARAFAEHCDILTVRANGIPLSSVFSFYFRNRVMPYYTGSLPEARGLGTNDLMYWKLMRHAVARGCEIFDFGRSKVDTGPFAFKKNWGFEPRPVTHQYKLLRRTSLPNVSPANPKYTRLVRLWRMLPLPVANAASAFVSSSLG